MSDEPPKEHLTVLPFPEPDKAPGCDNSWVSEAFANTAERAGEYTKPVASIAVCVAFEDGQIATMWQGSHLVLLAGALETVKARLLLGDDDD